MHCGGSGTWSTRLAASFYIAGNCCSFVHFAITHYNNRRFLAKLFPSLQKRRKKSTTHLHRFTEHTPLTLTHTYTAWSAASAIVNIFNFFRDGNSVPKRFNIERSEVAVIHLAPQSWSKRLGNSLRLRLSRAIMPLRDCLPPQPIRTHQAYSPTNQNATFSRPVSVGPIKNEAWRRCHGNHRSSSQ